MLEKIYAISRSSDDDLLHVFWRRKKGLHCGATSSWRATKAKKPTCPKCAEALAQALWKLRWGHLLEWLILKPLLWLSIALSVLVITDLTFARGMITSTLTSWLYP
ncbi:hypothetical protein GCM10009647_081490 [Streptomyces sanglieri]|uniref:Uncharacterized protein n=1 Tax=Streptomyces sanglieri TaxID=193460 RepID=A0ABW2WNV0_9ACTN